MTWLVFWSNDRQAHRILREGDPQPSADYVQVGEFADYPYAVEFVEQRMSVRRLTITSEDAGNVYPVHVPTDEPNRAAKWRICPRCEGSRYVGADQPCPACGGLGGWIENPNDQVIGP